VSGVASAAGRIWVASPGSKEIVAIDPATERVVQRIPVTFEPQDLLAAYGDLWVTIGS
jgi:YVTN family beta-propeller protein